MGITEGSRQFIIRNHGGSFGKQSKRKSGKVTKIVLETDMMAKRNQGSTEEITIQVNQTVTKHSEKLEEPEGQIWKMDSLKESQNDKRPRSWATVKTLSSVQLVSRFRAGDHLFHRHNGRCDDLIGHGPPGNTPNWG